METSKNLIKSKKFWTLVAALVAAFAAFFTVSCSSAFRLNRSGVHCDTVQVEYKGRSNNYQKFDL